MLRTWQLVTLLLAALGLSLGAAHALEMPAKLAYDGALYATVNRTLYRLYGTAGALVQVGAALAAVAMTGMMRRRPGFGAALAGTLGLWLSLALWGAIVAPVNAEWGRVIETDPTGVPAAYLRLRLRWEIGHLAAFAVWLGGYVLLLHSALGRESGR